MFQTQAEESGRTAVQILNAKYWGGGEVPTLNTSFPHPHFNSSENYFWKH